MLIITKRKQIGAIRGHTVYAIAKSEMIALPHSTVESDMTYSKYENRFFDHCTLKETVEITNVKVSDIRTPDGESCLFC